MISPTCGIIWIPMISTTNTSRPVKRNLASATAARKASTIERATVMLTTIRLLTTEFQKYGWSEPEIASRKCESVARSGIQVGDVPMMSLSSLNAVVTIQ